MSAKYNQFTVLLIALGFVLSSCGPVSSEAPIGNQVQVKTINEGTISQNQITQVKVFDQCQSASPLTAEVSFSEALNTESGKELILGMTAGGKMGISKVAEVAIEGDIHQHFSEKVGQTFGHTESIQIQVPPFTKQQYTIIWTEYRQDGTVDYTENGQDLSVGFSYRIGVAITSSSVIDLDCSGTAQPGTTSVPISTSPVNLPGEDWAQNCISTSIWSPSLAGEPFSQPPDCYQLIQWGLTPFAGILNMATQRAVYSAKNYGLFSPWQGQWTELDLTIRAKRLKNSEIWVGLFADKTMAADGLVLVIQPNDNFDIRINPSEIEASSNVYLGSEGGNYERVRLSMGGGKLMSTVDGQVIISDWPINFEIRYLYIGYRALPSMDLDAQISNLKFIP